MDIIIVIIIIILINLFLIMRKLTSEYDQTRLTTIPKTYDLKLINLTIQAKAFLNK